MLGGAATNSGPRVGSKVGTSVALGGVVRAARIEAENGPLKESPPGPVGARGIKSGCTCNVPRVYGIGFGHIYSSWSFTGPALCTKGTYNKRQRPSTATQYLVVIVLPLLADQHHAPDTTEGDLLLLLPRSVLHRQDR